jgi:DNA transformation protein
MDAEGIRELFADILPVRVRRMFGGHGVYEGERMFALEAGGLIYLKADGESEGRFAEAGSERFSMVMQGKLRSMGYWRLPDEALDDVDALKDWTQAAIEAARRGVNPVRRRASRPNPERPR